LARYFSGRIIYLRQFAVLRSNSEKHRFESLVVSAGGAPLVRGCVAQIFPRFVYVRHCARCSDLTGNNFAEIAVI
jgi:hypothetical protein